MKIRLGFVLFLGMFLGSASVYAAPPAPFLNAGFFSGSISPAWIEGVDINQDGRDDLMMSDTDYPVQYAEYRVATLIAPLWSSLGETIVTVDSGAGGLDKFSVSDVDGDGLPDVIVTINEMSVWGEVYVHNGATNAPYYNVPRKVNSADGWSRAGDLDGDGVAELIDPKNSFPFDIYDNDSTGLFSVTTPTFNPLLGSFGSYVVAVDDLDNDGLDEILFVRDVSPFSLFHVRYGVPDYLVTDVGPMSNAANQILTVDIDSDGDKDVFVLTDGPDRFLAKNGGGLAPAVVLDSSNSPTLDGDSADFNADGYDDVVTLKSNIVKVYLGGPMGPTLLWSASATGLLSVAAIDKDNDGAVDIVATTASGMLWWRNTALDPTGACSFNSDCRISEFCGDGGLCRRRIDFPGALQSSVASTAPNDFVLVDYDQDGYLDIVSARTGTPNVVGHKNDGMGGFGATVPGLFATGTGNLTKNIDAGDCDRDGYVDIVGTSDTGVFVYKYDPATQKFTGNVVISGADFEDVIWVDANNDGLSDIFVSSTTTAKLYLNQGSCSFGSDESVISLTAIGRSVAASANSATGDIIFAIGSDNQLEIHRWNPSTSVMTQIRVVNNVGSGLSVAFGDFDKDNRRDLVVASGVDGRITYLRAPTFDVLHRRKTPTGTAPGIDFAAGIGSRGAVLAVADGTNRVYWYKSTNRRIYRTGGVQGTGSTYTKVKWGDVDQSGSLDLVVLDSGSNQFRTFLSSPRMFGPYGVNMADSPSYTRWADFSPISPGWPDMLLRSPSGILGRVNQYSNLIGGPNFAGNNAQDLVWGDIDGDGLLDFLTAANGGVDYSYLNTGSGFTPQPLGTSGASTATALGDFDNDGDMDALIATVNGIEYFEFNSTTNTFAPSTSVVSGVTQVSDFAVADFDNNGNLDFFWSSTSGSLGGGLQKGVGDGTFSTGWGAGTRLISSVGVADFNQDGFPDIVAGLTNNKNILLTFDGLNFLEASQSPESENTRSIAVGDITGDGFPEVVTSQNNGPLRAYGSITGTSWSLIWSSRESFTFNTDVQLVDFDRDGDLDLVASLGNGKNAKTFRNHTNPAAIYPGTTSAGQREYLTNQASYIYIDRPGGGAGARGYSSAKKVSNQKVVPISFWLFDREGDNVPVVRFQYSVDYGPWTNLVISGTPAEINAATTNLSASESGTQHGILWDPTNVKGEFVRVRGIALQNPSFQVGGGVHHGYLSAISPGITLDPMDCNGGADCVAGEICVEDTCLPACPCTGGDVCLSNMSCATGTPTACVDDTSCSAGQFCSGGSCYDPCASITCPGTQICYGGSCYDPCVSNGDCTPPFACVQNRCTLDACDGILCPTGETCYEGGCYPTCVTSATCGGDTCFESGPNDRCSANACDGVQCAAGEACYEGGCFPTCVDDGGCTPPSLCFNGYCSEDPCDTITCPVSQVCYGGSCFDPCANTGNCTPPDECYNATFCASDPCAGVLCPSGQACYQGTCYDGCAVDGDCSPPNVCFDSRCTTNDCDGVLCPEGQICYGGGCFDPCANDGNCTPPEACWTNRCAADPCDDIGCPAGQFCYQGGCFDSCVNDGDCSPPNLCYENRCTADPCQFVECPMGEVCTGGSCFVGCAFNTDCPNYGGQTSTFTDVASGAGVLVSSSKEAGSIFGDFNNDGCLDLMVGSRNYLAHIQFASNCAFPDPVFTALSECDRPNLYDRRRPRSTITGDLNNDGWPDLVRNSNRMVEVYVNDGTGKYLYNPLGSNRNCPATAVTDWSLGGGHSIYAGTRGGKGINAEGVFLIDYDGDKDLDLFIEEAGEGLLVFRNNICAAGVCGPPSSFSLTEISASSLGINTNSRNGDYCAAADIDVDGDVDFICRKPGTTRPDLYINNGTGTFTGSTTFNQPAQNSNKGGVTFCDLDNDGDFDMFWTDGGTSQIWEQTAPNTWLATGEPALSSGVALPNNIDGVSCGDIDNDGDLDLFLTARGDDFLFVNKSSTVSWRFEKSNFGITGDDNGESVVMGDYDRSGSLDVFINQTDTQLWKNPRVDDRYLIVRALVDLGGGVTRDGIGATMTFRDADGVILGLREVSGGKGHGAQEPAYVHYGLPYGANVPYSVTVQYPHGVTVEKCIVPSSFGAAYHLLEITDTDSDDAAACTGAGSWQSLIETPSDDEFCYTDHCAEGPCDGIQCPASQTCYGGNCKDTCISSITCPAGEVCDGGKCVAQGDPECDGGAFNCPATWDCINGECFPVCLSDSDCSSGEICYNGICKDTDCSTVACAPGESCQEGVCFRNCGVDSDCLGRDKCYEGRCASDGCQALTTAYDADFLFRKLDRIVVGYQDSTAWFWPRPVRGAGDVSSYVALSGGKSTNPDVPSPGKARVMLYLDPSESDGDNPDGRYMLWLQHGATVGQGAASATYRVRLDDPSNDDPDVVLNDDAEGYRVLDSYEWVIETQSTSGANDTGGVVIGPIDASTARRWTIRIDAAFAGDITGWEFYNADGQIVELDPRETLWLRSASFNDSDSLISPDSYMPCRSNNPTYKGICKRGFGRCNDERRLVCVPTVAAWAWEVCDGLDNNCNGQVDELFVVPQPQFKQGDSEDWKTWLTVDENRAVGEFMNYTPVGADDRSGGADMITATDGAIQDIDYNTIAAHRDLRNGMLSFAMVNGRPTTGVAANSYGDYKAKMRMKFPGPTDTVDELFISWYDDREPGDDVDGSSTDDKLPDWEDPNEFDLEWKVEKTGNGAMAYRDSDGVAMRSLWSMKDPASYSMEAELEWREDDDDDYDDSDEFKWRLYAPSLSNTSLKKSKELNIRVVPRFAFWGSACLSSTTTAAGCSLGRFQCNAGALSCGAAADAVCNQCNDSDGDGFDGFDPVFCSTGRDCDDSDSNTNPNAQEICDGFDNDCDGRDDIKDDDAYLAFWGEPRPVTAAKCPSGTKCGPQECQFNLTCICPTGPGPNCRCGEGLDEGDEVLMSVDESTMGAASAPPSNPSNDSAKSDDPQAACASAPLSGKSRSAFFAYLVLGVFWLRRRPRGA